MMANGVCRVLIPGAFEEAFLFIVQLLKTMGVSLHNPGTAKITTWTDDGDQVEVPEAKIVNGVVASQIRNIQFWKTESEDIFVAWRNEDAGCLFCFYLDGLHADVTVTLASKLAEAVLTEYRTQYRDGTAFTIEFE